MSILRVKDDKGNIIPIPAIKGDKGDRGDSGVYVGSGAIPSGCNVKIDPNGEADDVVTRAEFEELSKNLSKIQRGTRVVQDAISGGYKSAFVGFETPFDTVPTSVVVTVINGEEVTLTPDYHVGYLKTTGFTIYYKANHANDTKFKFSWIAMK